MAQSSETKLNKRFDQNIEVTGTIKLGVREQTTAGDYTSNKITLIPPYHTGGPFYIKTRDDASNAYLTVSYGASEVLKIKHDGTLSINGSNVLTSVPSEYLTQTEGDARYIQSIPSEYLTQTEGDARYLQSFDITTQTDTKYLRSNANDNFSGQLTNNSLNQTPSYDKGAINLQPSVSGGSTGITFRSKVNSTSDAGYIWWYDDNDHYNTLNSTENGVLLIAAQNDGGATSMDAIAIESSGDIYLNPGVASGATGSGIFNSTRGNIYLGYASSRSRILTTADEGSGNGIDADTVDGLHASSFASSSHTHSNYLRSDTSDTMSGTLTANTIRVDGTVDGYYGYTSESWGGSSNYPTLYSSNANRYIMLLNPHISYTVNGQNGYTGGMTGATIRFASNYNAPSVWDLGVGTNGSGADVFSIGRDSSSKLKIDSSAKVTIGGSGQIPQLTLLYNTSASGAGWDTAIITGRSDDLPEGTGFPAYVPAGAYGTLYKANSDGVFFGMEEYSTGNYRPIIQWGDDNTDTPFRIKHENGSEVEVSWDGVMTVTTSVNAPSFYDSNNTNYLVNPYGASTLNGLKLTGANGNNVSGSDFVLWVDKPNNNDWSIGITNRQDYGLYMDMASGFNYGIRIMNAGTEWFKVNADYTYHASDMRSPLFYDSDSTVYYVDPNSTSKMLSVIDANDASYVAYKHSGSDFTSGTLVTTDIPATATNGASFVLDATGKSYSSDPIFSFSAQGYLYNNGIINYSGQHYGKPGFATMKIFEYNGTLSFWWPRVSYWNSFEVRVRDAGGSSRNRVVNVINSTEPTGTKKVSVTMKANLIYDYNPGSTIGGDLYGQILYDTDATGYYVNPASTSNLNTVTAIDFQTTSRQAAPRWDTAFYVLQAQHWYGDNNTQTMYVGEDNYIHLRDNVEVTDDIRSPIYYDRDNTTYYVNPQESWSANFYGGIKFGATATQSHGGFIGRHTDGLNTDIYPGPIYSIGEAYRPSGTGLANFYGVGYSHSNASFISMTGASGWVFYVAADGDARVCLSGSDGRVSATGAAYIPIYYDYNNTTYYANPASTSQFVALDFGLGGTSRNGSVAVGLGDGSLHFRSMTDYNHKMWYYDGVNISTNPSHGHIRFWADSVQRNASTGGSYLRFDVDCQNAIATTHGTFKCTGDIIAYSSDARLKENLRPIENALEKVKSIRGVIYDWKDVIDEYEFKPRNRKNDIGVIAQEVEAVMPQVVTLAPFDTEMDDEKEVAISKSGENYKTVQYEKLVPLLIEAIKEQQNQIDELKKLINL